MDNTFEDDNTLSCIESQHRKERRELQAKIQGLKKAAKNDKTKKKEIIAEIARLEANLEARHTQELEKCINEVDLLQIDDQEQIEEGRGKVSKAQKRRNKKDQQERDREEQIKLQEKENRHGPRNLELQQISTRLKLRNLSIFSIPSDGDCLYKAIAHQLACKKNNTVTVEDLRINVSNYIKSNKDDFLPFLTNPNTSEMLTAEEFDAYCDEISNTKVWGGQLEVRALSDSLKCPITIIQASGTDTDQGNEYDGPPLVITYHRYMYSLGEHYNSTQPLVLE